MTRPRLAACAIAACVCTAGAVFLIGGLRPAGAQAASTGAPAAHTPMWSARRVPTLVAGAVEGAARARASKTLTAALSTIVAPYDACVAVDETGGKVLARLDADTPLAPASTLKLLTATAAIARLGPDHRFTTTVLAEGDDLVVVGGGDPMLATPEYIAHRHAQPRYLGAQYTPLVALADAVVAAGVHDVTGDIFVDDHLHDSLRYLPDWKANYGVDGDVGSLGALSVDGGFTDPVGRSPANDPAVLTGQRLAALLGARGVTITGGVRRGLVGADAREVAHVDSAPLSEIVGEMLTSSDDYTAEELLRDLAVGSDDGTPATTDAGARIVHAEMDRLGVGTAGLVMHDGSGLAPNDRATCATLLRLLEVTTQPRFAAVDRGLAIAATSGTLIARFGGGPLAGRLRAKTGSLDGVVGLVGHVGGPDEPSFAFLANGAFSAGTGEELQAAVANAVADTPSVAPPPDLVPAP